MLAWVIQAGAINPFTHLVGGGDGFIQGIAAKTFSTSFCPWNPYVQSGKFVFADVLYQSFYPPSLILLSIFPNTFGFNLFLLIHYALAGLFVYFYLGSLRLTNYSAFAGGLIFMSCGFMTAHKGHEYILSAAVWLPLTLHFIHRYAERLRILDLGYAAVPVALSVLAGFPQITLYSTVLAIAYIPFCFAGSPSMRGWKTKVAHIVFAELVVLGIGGLLGSLPLFSVAATLPAFTRERITYGMFTSDNFPPLPASHVSDSEPVRRGEPPHSRLRSGHHRFRGRSLRVLRNIAADAGAGRPIRLADSAPRAEVLECGRGHCPRDLVWRDDPDLFPPVSCAGVQPVSGACQAPLRSRPGIEPHRRDWPGYPPDSQDRAPLAPRLWRAEHSP